MQNAKQHITYKAFTLFLVVTMLMPSAVKLMHAFNHHQHEICNGENQIHLHKSDLDCDFYKFKVNNISVLATFNFAVLNPEIYPQTIKSQYEFTSDYQKLPFSLRGPPQINLS